MSKPATIGALARAAALPVSTLRFWEREGLLKPDGRTAANYRWYGPEALPRIRFIRVAQSVGFTLEDVRALLDLREGRTARCADVRRLMERRLGEIERRIGELRDLHTTLGSLVSTCRSSPPAEPCRALRQLDPGTG
jgi:DNA-binding transcriptional MerR regulator